MKKIVLALACLMLSGCTAQVPDEEDVYKRQVQAPPMVARLLTGLFLFCVG